MNEELVISVILLTANLLFLTVIIIEIATGKILTYNGYGTKRRNEPMKYWSNMVGQIVLFLVLSFLFVAASISEK